MPGMPVEPILARLRANRGETLLVCGVHGGVLAEGVDYPGEMAIGVFVVGPGLPKVERERELVRECFEARARRGLRVRLPAAGTRARRAGRAAACCAARTTWPRSCSSTAASASPSTRDAPARVVARGARARRATRCPRSRRSGGRRPGLAPFCHPRAREDPRSGASRRSRWRSLALAYLELVLAAVLRRSRRRRSRSRATTGTSPTPAIAAAACSRTSTRTREVWGGLTYGEMPRDELYALYEARGYDVIGISDYMSIAPPQAGQRALPVGLRARLHRRASPPDGDRRGPRRLVRLSAGRQHVARSST